MWHSCVTKHDIPAGEMHYMFLVQHHHMSLTTAVRALALFISYLHNNTQVWASLFYFYDDGCVLVRYALVFGWHCHCCVSSPVGVPMIA